MSNNRNHISSLLARAEEHQRTQDWRGAADLYEELLKSAPLEAELWYQTGYCLQRSGEPEKALQYLEKATILAPENATYEIEKGDTLQGMRRLREAVIAYARALEIDPKNVTAYTNLGIALKEGGHSAEAVANLECAIELAPDDPVVRLNYGSALMHIGDLPNALEQFQTATSIAPHYAEAWSNLGFALHESLRSDEAIKAHERALTIAPDIPAIHWNYAMTLLALGDYENGLREFEYRREMPDRKPRPFPSPEWTGQDLSGRRLLVHAEQGLGDTLQYARFFSRLSKLGAEVVVSVQSALATLIEDLEGVSQVVAGQETPPEHCYNIPIMSLPFRLGLGLDDLSDSEPYIFASGDGSIPVLKSAGKQSIGLVWAGNPRHANDRNRSCSLADFSPLFEQSNLIWYSLQVGSRASEFRSSPNHLVDLSPHLTDFKKTASAIHALDLVIAVDTAVAHLAGAMGKPVWILLPYAADWRWLTNRCDSPWYPSAHLFRQPTPGNWPSLINMVSDALAERVGQLNPLFPG